MPDIPIDLIRQLAELAKREHYDCEDCWYRCPKHPRGTCHDGKGTDCDCGADEHNAKVEEILAELLKERT